MKVNREEFLLQLDAVSPALPKVSGVGDIPTFTIYDGRVYAFDDEIIMGTECCVGDRQDAVSICVPAEPLSKLLRQMTEEEISLTEDKGKLKIKGKRKQATIPLQDVGDSQLEIIENPDKWKPISGDLTEAIKLVAPCAYSGEEGGVLEYVNMTPKFIEACSDFQYGRYDLKTGLSESFLLKSKLVKRIIGCAMVKYNLSDNWIHFRNLVGTQLSVRKFCGEYPDYSEVAGKIGEPIKLPINMVDAVRKSSIFTKGEYESVVGVRIENKQFVVKGKGKLGTYEESTKVSYDGQRLSFMVSTDLFESVLNSSSRCEVGDGFLKVVVDNFTLVVQLESK